MAIFCPLTNLGYNPLILNFDPNFQRDIQVSTQTFQIGPSIAAVQLCL